MDSTLTGPASYRIGALPGQRWTVCPDRISTVRTTPAPRPLRFDARPKPVEIDATRTALLVVDMQNDFVHPRGWFARKCVDVSALSVPVAPIAALAGACRRAEIPVVWLSWGLGAGAASLPASVLYRGKREAGALGYGEGGALVPGTWGQAVIDALAPQPGDIAVDKQRFSGFAGTALDAVLRHLNATTLLFAGVNVDRCVFSTLVDAAALGYDCLLVEDACATVSPPEIARAIVWLVAEVHGFVCTSDALLAALDEPGPKGPASSPVRPSSS